MPEEIVPIVLTEVYPAGTVKKTGSQSILLSEHDKVQVRVKVQGGDWVDYFDQTVPAGKQWSLTAGIFVRETDA